MTTQVLHGTPDNAGRVTVATYCGKEMVSYRCTGLPNFITCKACLKALAVAAP